MRAELCSDTQSEDVSSSNEAEIVETASASSSRRQSVYLAHYGRSIDAPTRRHLFVHQASARRLRAASEPPPIPTFVTRSADDFPLAPVSVVRKLSSRNRVPRILGVSRESCIAFDDESVNNAPSSTHLRSLPPRPPMSIRYVRCGRAERIQLPVQLVEIARILEAGGESTCYRVGKHSNLYNLYRQIHPVMSRTTHAVSASYTSISLIRRQAVFRPGCAAEKWRRSLS